jgi:hypothetical protein
MMKIKVSLGSEMDRLLLDASNVKKSCKGLEAINLKLFEEQCR